MLCFLLVILLRKTAPRHSAEVLSSDPISKEAVMYLTEKIMKMCVLDKLHSGMSYSAVALDSMLMSQQ